MANSTKTRGSQLIRADRSVSGIVTFYDTRITEASAARIGAIRFPDDCDAPAHVVRAAMHGWTQNLLDSSNKLEGDARVDFIRKGCETINAGGWVSAPVDDDKARENAAKAFDKMVLQGLITQAQADEMKAQAGLV